MPTAPAQLGSFEAAVLTATQLDTVGSVAFAVVLHAQQVLPHVAVGLVLLVALTRGRGDTPHMVWTPRV